MREIEGNIYVGLEELMQAGVPKSTVLDGFQRGSSLWQSIADPCDGRRRLIRYETLAPKYKDLLKAKYWQCMEPQEWRALQEAQAKEGPLEELKRRLKAACEKGYMLLERKYSYRLKAESDRTRAMQLRCLCRSAAVVMTVGKWYNEMGISFKKYDGYKVAGEWLEANKNQYFPKMYVRSNPTGLADQVRRVFVDKEAVEEVVFLPRVNNDNRLGKNYTFGIGAMTRLLTQGKTPSIVHVYRKVAMLCELNELEAPSESTIRNWEIEVRQKISAMRYGIENKASAKMRTSVPLARPMNAGDLWEMDGTRVQLQPHLTQNGKIKSLYVVAIRDVYSGAWLGWDFVHDESFFPYHKALKMAVTLTGYLPYELKHDAFPGSNRDEWDRFAKELKKMGVKLTETRTATGKASTERAFGTLQTVFEMESRSWVGQGITSSRSYNRPTKEYLEKTWKALKAEGRDWAAACAEEAELLMAYNSTPLSAYSKKYKNIEQSPMELHNADRETSKDDRGKDASNVILIHNWEIAELFWATRKVKIRNYAITLTVRGEECLYTLAEEKYYDLVTNKRHADGVLVRYDADDMSSVMVFDARNGELLHEVPRFDRIQLAGADPEYKRLGEFRAGQKALKVKINQEVEAIKQGCEVDVHMGGIRPKEGVERAQDAFFHRQVYNEPVAKKAKSKEAKTKEPKRQIMRDGSKEGHGLSVLEQIFN